MCNMVFLMICCLLHPTYTKIWLMIGSHHIMNTFLNQPDVPNVANKKIDAMTQTSDSVSHWLN